MTERITIRDEEMPKKIQGPFKSLFLLGNGAFVELGGHSEVVADSIESYIRFKGAKTKQDVLKALGDLEHEVLDGFIR